MPLRVLQVIEATTAGVKRHVLSLVRALDTERFQVTVACPSVRSHAYGDDSFSSELRARWKVCWQIFFQEIKKIGKMK